MLIVVEDLGINWKPSPCQGVVTDERVDVVEASIVRIEIYPINRITEHLRATVEYITLRGRETPREMEGVMRQLLKTRFRIFDIGLLVASFHIRLLLCLIFQRKREYVLWWWPNDCSWRQWCSSQKAGSMSKLVSDHLIRKFVQSLGSPSSTRNFRLLDTV